MSPFFLKRRRAEGNRHTRRGTFIHGHNRLGMGQVLAIEITPFVLCARTVTGWLALANGRAQVRSERRPGQPWSRSPAGPGKAGDGGPCAAGARAPVVHKPAEPGQVRHVDRLDDSRPTESDTVPPPPRVRNGPLLRLRQRLARLGRAAVFAARPVSFAASRRGPPQGAGSGRMGLRRLPARELLGAQEFCCLVLGVGRCLLGFCHRVAQFADQVFVDRWVVAIGGGACHGAGFPFPLAQAPCRQARLRRAAIPWPIRR